jgi:hypothetical protein
LLRDGYPWNPEHRKRVNMLQRAVVDWRGVPATPELVGSGGQALQSLTVRLTRDL